MQTNLLLLASGIHRLFSRSRSGAAPRHQRKGTTMSKTASIGLAPSSTLFGRLLATIDRLLMTSAADRDPQRRPPPLRSLRPANQAVRGVARFRFRPQFEILLSTNGPDFRGHFFVALTLVFRGATGHTSAAFAHGTRVSLEPWHIEYQNGAGSSAHAQKIEARREEL